MRKDNDNCPVGPGVADYESFRILQTQSGATLGVDIGKTSVGLMQAWVRGSTRDAQGLYRVDNVDTTAPTANTYLAQLNVTFSAADATNPRVDQVILVIGDTQHAGAINAANIQVLPGTATAGATLDNRTGVATLPASCILLADVLVPAASTTVVTANIVDRRSYPLVGGNPQPSFPAVFAATDAVTFAPHPAMPQMSGSVIAQGSFDSFQAATLMYLPRGIKSATRLRFKYRQGATAANTFYQVAIFDSSGRLKVATGASVLVYAGTATVTTAVSATIAATTFEPGWYYVWVGNAAATAGSGAFVYGSNLSIASPSVTTSVPSVPPNIAFYKASGGQTVPNTFTGYLDLATNVADINLPTIPVVTLSVG